MKKLMVLLLIILLYGCSSTKQQTVDGLVTIPLADLIDKEGVATPLESVAKEIKTIPLETTDASLVKYVGFLHYENEKIYTEGEEGVLIFDDSGRFLNKFGYRGEDEQGYIHREQVLSMPDQMLLYDSNLGKVLEYSKEGKYMGQFKVPYLFRGPIYPISENEFVGYNANYSGKEYIHFGTFEKDGEELKDTIFHRQYESELAILFFNEGAFYPFEERVSFKEYFNDTIYTVQGSHMEPHYFLELGKKRTHYDDRSRMVFDPAKNIFKEWVPIIWIGETNDYLVFTAEGTILYNKRTREVKKYILMYEEEEYIPAFISKDSQWVIGVRPDEEGEDNPTLILVQF